MKALKIIAIIFAVLFIFVIWASGQPTSPRQIEACQEALMNKGYSPQNYAEQAAMEERVRSECY